MKIRVANVEQINMLDSTSQQIRPFNSCRDLIPKSFSVGLLLDYCLIVHDEGDTLDIQ